MAHLLRAVCMVVLLGAGCLWLAPRQDTNVGSEVRFEEKAAASGCLNNHTKVVLADAFTNIMPWLCSVGAAAAAADYDGDGYPDLYVVNSGRNDHNHLFRNRGDGTFEDMTAVAGVGCTNFQGGCMHAIWGDINNDGHLDLYVAKWGESNTLYLNRGDGTFVDISHQAGVDCWGYANAATFLDYDRDGYLDILVSSYFAEEVKDPKTGKMVRNDLWHPVTTKVMQENFTHARNGGHKTLLRNRGDGTFEDVTEKVGLKDTTFWTLAVGSGDLNNDGWPDLYIANDFGPDELYLNTGATENPPRFRRVVDPAGHPGVGNDWWKGMNVDMADVNNDGYLDIYVSNIFERRYKTDEGNMLWLNCVDPKCSGGRGFRNIAKASGTMDGGWGWAAKFADFNNDGLLDIYAVNGFVTGTPDQNYWYQIQEMVTQTKNQTVDARDWPPMGTRDLSGHDHKKLFMQIHPEPGHGAAEPHFKEMALPAGLGDTYNGRGIAVADFDLDGALDMYIANQGAPGCYYRNVTFRGKSTPGFLRILLVGRPDLGVRVGDRVLASTANAVGARVTLHTAKGIQMREVQGGMGFASQSEYALHFGVPDPAAVERITIQWPSSRVQELTGAQARALVGHHVRMVEGEVPIMVDPVKSAGRIVATKQ